MKTVKIAGIELDLQLTIALTVTTLCGILAYYGRDITGNSAVDRAIYYLLIPCVTIILPFRESLREYGFRIGRWKEGLLWVFGVCAVMSIVLYLFTRSPEVNTYYSAKDEPLFTLLFNVGLEMFAWEFLWRGVMLFLFAKRFGIGTALWLQAIPFALFHLGKPEIETLSTLFGGIGFGFIAWRTQSFIYPWLIHTFLGVVTVLMLSL